jgi:cell division septum initiation protein DivIVA
MQDQPVSVSENTLLQLQEEREKLVQINTEQEQRITYLEHELAQLKRMIFGSKSIILSNFRATTLIEFESLN